jgi:hypothetical protein|tara:strand:+ start:756 stop:1382 length:627 start_codon:yes stop_codon:yes gene_type:complete
MATKSSGYDVKAVHLTADTQALDADGISAAAAVGNNAALTIGGALASGGSCTFDAGRVVTILSAGDDSAISFTVVGTDVNGDAQTESVTGANAGTATGSNYFKTVTSITAVGDPAGNVSAGVNASAADVVFGGRSRFQGINLVCTGTAGVLNFLTTSPTGTSIYKVGTVASATATRDLTIPDEGMVFSAGIYVQYTVSTFNTLTVFHA